MMKAFLAIAQTMARLNLKDRDIEIIIRCRTHSIQSELQMLMADEAFQNGNYIEDDTVKKGYSEGKAHGVPYRFEALHR